MWRVTGINLLTCVNWAAWRHRALSRCESLAGEGGVERIFIYYMFAVIKSCGRLICLARDGSIFPSRWPECPLASVCHLTCEGF